MLSTRICSLLGIDVPIISAPMAGTASAVGDATTAPVRAGTASGLISSVEPAADILREIVSQAEDILRHHPRKLLGE